MRYHNNIKLSLSSKHLSQVIAMIFYLLLITFLALYLKNLDLNQLKDIKISWDMAILASAVGLFFRFWSAFIWYTLLKSLGAKDLNSQIYQLLYVYAKSWMGRYIPGTAPWILGKIYFASRLGISKNKLAISSLLEGGLQIVVLMAVSLALLLFDQRLDIFTGNLKFAMGITVVLCFVLLSPKVFNRFAQFAYKLAKKKTLDQDHHINSRMLIKGTLYYTIGALLSGLSLYLIAKSVYSELGIDDITLIMGIGNLGAVVGMLAFFTPSGLGVREGLQLILFSLIMPTEIALAIIVITRIWATFLDFAFFGLGYMLRKTTLHTQLN